MKKAGMKKLLYGWYPMRILRLVIGLFAVSQAIIEHEWPIGIAGAFLSVMAIANVGCCHGNTCVIPRNRNSPDGPGGPVEQ